MRLIRVAFGKAHWQSQYGEARASNEAILKRVELDRWYTIIGRKKAMWYAHVIRGDEKLVLESFSKSREHNDRNWTKLVKDLERVGLTVEKIKELAKYPSALKKMINDYTARPHSDQPPDMRSEFFISGIIQHL